MNEHFINRCRKFVEYNVHVNQSSLVEELFLANIFEFDDIENLYRPLDLDELEYAFPEEFVQWQSADTDLHFRLYLTEVLGIDQSDVEEINEIYEWYIVSDLLGAWLERYKQPQLKNDYGTWWGRCTFGMEIAYDSVIQDIVKELYPNESET